MLHFVLESTSQLQRVTKRERHRKSTGHNQSKQQQNMPMEPDQVPDETGQLAEKTISCEVQNWYSGTSL